MTAMEMEKPATEIYTDVLVELRRIIRATDLHSKRLFKESGLTIPQVMALQAIRDLGEVTSRELSDRINLSQGTTTTILDRLETHGLIARYRSDRDRRIVHARLTDAGSGILDRAPPLLHEQFVRRFQSLPASDQYRVLTALRLVADMMGASELDAAPLLDVPPPDTTPH